MDPTILEGQESMWKIMAKGVWTHESGMLRRRAVLKVEFDNENRPKQFCVHTQGILDGKRFTENGDYFVARRPKDKESGEYLFSAAEAMRQFEKAHQSFLNRCTKLAIGLDYNCLFQADVVELFTDS